MTPLWDAVSLACHGAQPDPQGRWWFSIADVQLASKSNSRQYFGKSAEAVAFKTAAVLKLNQYRMRINAAFPGTMPLECNKNNQWEACLFIQYASWLPDADGELFFDCLQAARVIENDRYIRVKHIVAQEVATPPRVACWLRRIDHIPCVGDYIKQGLL